MIQGGNNPDKCILNEIPYHVKIEKGDTLITSGYSAIFPEGILIGTVEDYHLKDGNFFEIDVRLALDMRKLSNVIIIKNTMKEEQVQLEYENEIIEND